MFSKEDIKKEFINIIKQQDLAHLEIFYDELFYHDLSDLSGSFGANAMWEAINTGSPQLVEFLIKNGVDVNYRASKKERSFLMLAADPPINVKTENRIKIIELLLNAGADIEAKIEHVGYTAERFAQDTEKQEVIELLRNARIKKIKANLAKTSQNPAEAIKHKHRNFRNYVRNRGVKK